MFCVHFINEVRSPINISFTNTLTLDNLFLLQREIELQAQCTVLYLCVKGDDNRWTRPDCNDFSYELGVFILKEVEVWLTLRGFDVETVSKFADIKTLAHLKTLTYGALRQRLQDINTILNILRQTAAL